MVNILITLAIIGVCLAVTFLGGVVALVVLIVGGLLTICHLDPKGLAS